MSLNPDQTRLKDPPNLQIGSRLMGRGGGVGERRIPVVDGLDVAGEVLRLDDRDIVAAGRRHRRRFPLCVRDLEAAAIRFGRLEGLC
jgi:hypothetical protein